MATLQQYETVIIFDLDVNDEALRTNLDRVAAIVAEHSGKVIREDIWGRRQLAFPMNKKDYGTYVVLVLEGDSALVRDLERQLHINEAVLRVLTVEKDEFAPDLRPELVNPSDDDDSSNADGLGDDASLI